MKFEYSEVGDPTKWESPDMKCITTDADPEMLREIAKRWNAYENMQAELCDHLITYLDQRETK